MQSCITQIGPNQVTEGHYTLDAGVLTMVYSNGEPVALPDGSHVRHTMRPDDDARAIAMVLTKEIRTKLRGEIVPGFGRALPDYEVVV